MRTRVQQVGVVLGAIAGGVVVGSFQLQPVWLWGMGGGAAGGLLGALAAHVTTLRWHWPLRALAAALIVAGGFFALWVIAAGQFVLDPRNYDLRSP